MGKLKLKRPQNLSESFHSFVSKETWRKIQHKALMMFGMDYRSMALFRVTMALCVIGDVIERATDLRVMYTDYGVMPRHLITSRYSSNYFLPIHLVNTSLHFQAFLFIVHIIIAFAMLIGYRTKLTSILTWLMTISLQAYIGVVGHGGDVFFRMMLFLNIFIPTSKYFSWDSATFYQDLPSKRLNNNNNNFNIVNNIVTNNVIINNVINNNNINNNNNNNNNTNIPVINLSEPESPLQQQQLLQQQLQHDQQLILQQSSQQQQQDINKSEEVGIEIGSERGIEQKVIQPKRDPDSYRFLSFGTCAILLQIGLMYCTSYFHKSGEEWHNGEATFYALTLDYFATDIAKLFLYFRPALKILTLAVAKWELYGILFLISPIYSDWCRFFGAIGFIAMHAGFIMCLRLGLFFFVTAGAELINIPTTVWELFFDWTDKKILKGQQPTRVYYNTTSPISQRIALILKTYFIIPGHAVFSPLEKMLNNEDSISTSSPYLLSSSSSSSSSNDNSGSDTDDAERSHRRRTTNLSSPTISSTMFSTSVTTTTSKKDLVGDDWLVTIDSNGIRKRNIHALNYICSKSPLLFPLAMAFTHVPANMCMLFTKICQKIHSRSQQSLIMSGGKRTLYQKKKNPIPQTPRIYSILNNIWMLFICYFLFAYNMNIFDYSFGFQPTWHQFAYIFRLDQSWNMFSPSPPKTHWWHVIHGELDDGTKVELFKNEGMFNFQINTEVNFEKPDPFYKSYGNHRWFKYYENGYNQANSDSMRLEHGRYLCREFNKRHTGHEQLYKFSVFFVHEFQNLDGTVGPKNHFSLWDHICYDKKQI
ncbi:hypothetical protein ACTFIU_010917 [Dictyostelium citrinum]